MAFPAFGRGGQDAELARADELIQNRQHSEAILVLTDYARRNPNKFEHANQRLRRIYQIRDEFNRTADELIWTLLNDPENNDKILALSRHLYTLEHEDSPLLANFVARTREIAQFNVNRVRLRGILERGREHLDRGESAAALRTYAEGLDFMREEFFMAGYGAAIENEVRRETENVNSILASFQQVSSQMGTISAELIRTINAGNTAQIPEITGRLTIAMDNFIAQKQRLYASVNNFERLLNSVRAINQDTGDRNHLSFVSIIIRGRSEEAMEGPFVQEGMLGAFDNYWDNSIGSVVNNIAAYIGRANASSITALNARNYSEVISSLNTMGYYVNLTPLYFDKHRQLMERPQTTVLYGSTILGKDIRPFLEIRALNEANNFLMQAANVAERQNFNRSALERFMASAIGAAQAISEEQQTRSEILAAQRSITDIVTRANQVHADINRHQEIAHVRNAANAIDGMRAIYTAEEQQSIQRYFAIAQSGLQNNVFERRAQLERGRNLLNGQTQTNAEGTTVTYRYPTEALAELTAVITATNADLQLAAGGDEGTVNVSAEHRRIVNDLNEIRNQATAMAETARTRSSQAQAYRTEGERLFREAQTAAQRRDFDTARTRVDQAARMFDSSLEIQESAALRRIRDNDLLAFGRSMATAENEIIIAEVRAHIDRARNLYNEGNFGAAEEVLLIGRGRWRIVNPHEEHEEIVVWLNLVRTAIAASSARIISPTAPLYPEMSQLLNQAQRNYEEGVRFINIGQRNQGVVRFNEALQLTREVKLIFPVNQEAGILDLRIEQFLDPRAFNASFEQRLRTAIAGTKQKDMEAFADLLNLSEINPRYPNMRAIIIEAEIDMGIRPPPPSPAAVARSRELTLSASRILDSAQTAQYDVALIQLNEAINLNPLNADAPRVRDRLLRARNTPQNIALSSQDEAQYQRALRELQAGNTLEAFAIVQRLMQNPNNRNVQKVVELHERIRL